MSDKIKLLCLGQKEVQVDFVTPYGVGYVKYKHVEDKGEKQLYLVYYKGADGKKGAELVEVTNAEGINPTKVFKAIAKLLKDKLCPECK